MEQERVERLAIYVPHFDERPVGLGTYVHEVCTRIIACADSVDLYTETPETVPKAWSTMVTVHAIPSRRAAPSPAARLLLRQAWVALCLPRELKKTRASALFVPFHDGMPVPVVPQVVVVHDLTPLVIPSSYFRPLLRIHLKRWLPLILRRSTVVAVSRSTEHDLRRKLRLESTPIHVVGEGYDNSVFRPRESDKVSRVVERYGITTPYLLYSGTYAAHKNPVHLVEVLRVCIQRGLDLRLVLSGRPDSGGYSHVIEAVARYGLEDRVVQLGYVPRDDLSCLMGGAAAFLFPSKYEGFGLVPLEAMAAGAVVISSNRASLPEVVGDGGLLIDPTDVDAWVNAVESVVSDSRLASQLRARALERAKRFSWDDAAARIAQLIVTAANEPTIRTHATLYRTSRES